MTSEMGAEAITKEAFAGWTIATKIGGELGRSELLSSHVEFLNYKHMSGIRLCHLFVVVNLHVY